MRQLILISAFFWVSATCVCLENPTAFATPTPASILTPALTPATMLMPASLMAPSSTPTPVSELTPSSSPAASEAVSTTAAPLRPRFPAPVWLGVAPDGLSAQAMSFLSASQNATYNLQFKRGEALASRAIALFPKHPLPRIFLQMTLLSEIQELIDAKGESSQLFERYKKASDLALQLARKREQKKPDGNSQLYLGSILGADGLVAMMGGHYLDAYHDGQDAAKYLHLAVERDPKLYDAYLGLGQYDYYCGKMSGFLRFLVSLHGDVKGGISKLETCGRKGGYAVTAARINLARIYSLEEVDFSKALSYVRELRRRYPTNYRYVQYALATASGQGYQKPEAQLLLESVFKQYDQGWRPPQYASLDLERARLDLARAYLSQHRQKIARVHFKSLAKSKNATFAMAGSQGMNSKEK